VKAALAVAAAAAVAAPLAAADSFTPVTLPIHVAPVARLHTPLKVSVVVGADAGVLDDRFAPLRIEVKLASECGGAFQTTPGTTLLNKVLNPQPSTGRPYTAKAHGSGRPASYGVMTACVYLEEEGDNRLFGSDQSIQVDVSKRCTVAAARYDRARRHHRATDADRRHRRATAADRRAARRACGPGVPL
jgi:hypothetical protein